MPLFISDTLTGKKEKFKPLENNTVKVYVCGPTVYDYTHIGHARTYLAFDVIIRYLRYRGYKVKLIVNITDIDDKIIKKTIEENTSIENITRKYVKDFFYSIEKLGILKANYYPRVTEHIDDIIEVIKVLIKKGFAYVMDGDVYFEVDKFKEYGKLSHQSIKNLILGARIEPNPKKKKPYDFALWKKSKPNEPGWHSPWSYGRPGWHIECTVLSIKYLGEQIDIHGGGTDLIFPHHENEIAQSEAYTGKSPFTKYWLHVGMLKLSGEKMSKSLKNIISVQDFLKKFPADVLRLIIISSHYRNPIDFSFKKAKESLSALKRIYGDIESARVFSMLNNKGKEDINDLFLQRLNDFKNKFFDAMDDDFNTPLALSSLFQFLNFLERIDLSLVDSELLRKAYNDLVIIVRDILGFKLSYKRLEDKAMELINIFLNVREYARALKDWKISDAIREELRKVGIILEDVGNKTKWKYLPEIND